MGSKDSPGLGLRRHIGKRDFARTLGSGLVLMAIWAGISLLVPDGWAMGALNVTMLLVAILALGMNFLYFFRLYMPKIVALFCAILLLGVYVVGLRSLLLSLFVS